MPGELSFEVVSGPDVGGGYLLQLTWSPPPAESVFTVHLQEGGTDAAAAPASSPEPLGFAHPPASCPLGGPRCFERRFGVPDSDRSRVRLAYHRLRFVLGPLLEQYAGRRPVPVEVGLSELLARIEGPLGAEEIPWQVGGSTGAWLRGVEIAPRDIDIGTTAQGVARVAELLEGYLIAPVAASETTGRPSHRTLEAFVGTFRDGVRVDVGGDAPEANSRLGETEWGGPGVWTRREILVWNSHTIPVAPIEFEFARVAERGPASRLEPIVAYLRRHPPSPERLQLALDTVRLSPHDREQLTARVGPPG